MITASKAPGQPGSPDKTSEAADQVAAFVGAAERGDFAIVGDTVVYDGPDEWSYRRMILHYAKLCKAAGEIDAFLIGSELRGLTTLRSDANTYPFVNRLKTLAEDVRQILGPSVKVSYAADWTEYFGHHPDDGSGDVFFHLDPLWAPEDIDFIGIDNYMPLADWRDGSDHLDADAWDSGDVRPISGPTSPAARASTGTTRAARTGTPRYAPPSPTAPMASRGCSATRT